MKKIRMFLLLALPALVVSCRPDTSAIGYLLHDTYENSKISITFEDYNETELVFSITTLREEIDSMYDHFDFTFTGIGILDDFAVIVNGIETTTRDKSVTFYDVIIRLTESDMNRFVNDNCGLEIWGITFDII